MKSTGHLVEIAKARWNADHFTLVLMEIFDRVEIIPERFPERGEILRDSPLGDVEEELLGPIQRLVEVGADSRSRSRDAAAAPTSRR